MEGFPVSIPLNLSAATGSAPAQTTGRSKDPAFQNPNVSAAMRGLRDKLREALRESGDIDKDILQLAVQPWMAHQPAFANLRQGKTTRSGRQLPSAQYGWLQNFITKVMVRTVVGQKISQIVAN